MHNYIKVDQSALSTRLWSISASQHRTSFPFVSFPRFPQSRRQSSTESHCHGNCNKIRSRDDHWVRHTWQHGGLYKVLHDLTLQLQDISLRLIADRIIKKSDTAVFVSRSWRHCASKDIHALVNYIFLKLLHEN